MVFKRLISPHPNRNERNTLYTATEITQEECIEWLEKARDGVFGIEGLKTPFNESFDIVTPLFYKTENEWEKVEEDFIKGFLNVSPKEVTYVQFELAKPSVFPISMELSKSIWSRLKQVCPNDMTLFYQFLVQYRQDNWVDRLEEQYDDYLQGVETPSNNKTFRKLQRSLTAKIDDIFRWEYKHEPIEEIESKIQQDGYRFNFRMVLMGGIKKRRQRIIQQIQSILNSVSYLNRWTFVTVTMTEDVVDSMVKRKLNSVGKHQVLCTSEIVPFLMHTESLDKDNQLQEHHQDGLDRTSAFQRNPILELLPNGTGLPELDGKHHADKFIKSIKEMVELEEELKVKRVQYGATLMKMTFNLPRGLKLSNLVKKGVKDDLQVAMGVRNIQIEQGDNVGELAVFVPLDERRKVFIKDYLDTKAFQLFAESNPLPFLAGVDSIGQPIFRDLNKAKHLLIGGTTGSGKSTFVNQLILTLAMYKTPAEVEMYLIDVKQVELTQFRDFPHVRKVITDVAGGVKLLQTITKEMKQRYTLLEESGVKNIALYNNKHPKDKLPYIVCVIDEYAELTLEEKEVHKLVQSISQLARAVGIHLIVATQDPRKEIIPPIIKSNMPSKVGFTCSNENSYLTFLRAKPYFKLMGNGDGVLAFDGQAEDFIRFQGCMIIDDPNNQDLESELIERIAKELNKMYRDTTSKGTLVDPEGEVEEPVKVKSDIDRLKEIIIIHEETKVEKLREHMGIGMKKVSAMMKQLVEEGFLAEPETRQKGYKLIASEDEIALIRESIDSED